MLNLKHKNLDVWQISINVIADIYELTSTFPQREIYGLTSQIRRAAISISSNIAEGAARKSKIERRRFFEIARSSLVETDTQIEIAVRLNYLNEKNIESLGEELNKLFAKLSNLILHT